MSIRRLTPRLLARVDAAAASALGRSPSTEERKRAHRNILESLQRADLLRLVLSGKLLIRPVGGVLWLIPSDHSDGSISDHYQIQERILAAVNLGASLEPQIPLTYTEESAALGWTLDAISDSFLADMVVDGDLGIDPTAHPIRFPAIA